MKCKQKLKSSRREKQQSLDKASKAMLEYLKLSDEQREQYEDVWQVQQEHVM